MHNSSRERAKEPNPDIGIGNTGPLEQRNHRSRARVDYNLLGLVKSTRSSLTRRTSTSGALRASSIESYILSPPSRSTVKKLNGNRPTRPKTGNPTIPLESSDRPGTLNSDLTREATSYTPSSPSTSQKPELRKNPAAQPDQPGEGTYN